MSRTISPYLAVIAVFAVGGILGPPAAAQHHGGGHGSSHHEIRHGYSHLGGAYHSDWGHYVPTHHGHIGLYYSYNGANYYTPAPQPVQVQALRPQANGRPGFGAQPMQPIAPRSVKLAFGGFQQYEDLAGRLEIEANRLCLDMHYNYGHNPDFATTYGEAYKVMLAAKFAHAAEHRGDRDGICQEVAAVDPLFHHVQEVIATWTRDEHRVVSAGDINSKAAVVEAIMHHLQYDVGVKPQHGAPPEEQAPPPSEDATPPGAR